MPQQQELPEANKDQNKCNEISITVHLNVTQWFFLAIFMEHRLNTQHSLLMYSLL